MHWRRWTAGFLLVLFGWAVLCGVTLWQARGHAVRALDQASNIGTVNLDATTMAQQRAALAAAIEPLAAADRSLGRPWLLPIRPLPWAGTQLRSADALIGTALAAAQTGATLLAELESVRSALASGSIAPTEAVRRLRPPAEAALTAFEADLGPHQRLLPQLAAARDELVTPMAQGHDALEGVTTVLEGFERLLAGSRYLLLASNTSEMRVGSGMYLQAGIVSIDGTGSLTLVEFGSISALDKPANLVPVTDPDTSRHWASFLPTDRYQNVAVSPRFDVVADMAARMWEAGHPEQVDGVMSLDPVALGALVSITGPITMADGRQLNPADVAQFAGSDQYSLVGNATARHELLGEVSTAVGAALGANPPEPEALLNALEGPVRARHLKLWARDPIVQRAWVQLGAEAGMNADDLLLSVSNHNANKLDFLLGVGATLTTTPTTEPAPGAMTRRELVVTLESRVTGAEPSEVQGELQPGRYFGILTAHLPGGASAITLNGVELPQQRPPPAALRAALLGRTPGVVVLEGPDGPNELLGVTVALDPGAQHTVRIGFDLPADRSVQLVPSGRFPAIAWPDVAGAETARVQL